MAFQWLQMRIGEERDRRQKETAILERLPAAIEDLHGNLAECIEAYRAAFGAETADIRLFAGKIRVTAREHRNGKWEPITKLEIAAVPALPGFRVESGGEEQLAIEIGLLPNNKLSYRHADEYLTMEEITRRILDRTLFPKLKE